MVREVVGDGHQCDHREAQVVRGEISGNKARQNAERCAAFSAEVTTSLTCLDSTDVKTFTSSGMTAPARVPQEMMEASFHHCEVSPPRSGTIIFETIKVRMIETIEVSQTRVVSGASKFIFGALPYFALAMPSLRK